MTVNELIQELKVFDADDEVTRSQITIVTARTVTKLDYSKRRAKQAKGAS